MAKSKFAPIVLLLTIILFSPAWVQAVDIQLNPDGTVPRTPFDQLQAQIDGLQAQIDDFPFSRPQFILKDENGIEVGEVITVRQSSPVNLFTEMSVLTSLDIQKADGSTVTVAVPANRSGFQFQGRVVFDDANCEGTPRMRTDLFILGFPPALTRSAVVGGQPDVRKLYIQANDEEVPMTRTHQSILAEGFCIPAPGLTAPSVTMELANGQLHIDHPGPFTLERL